jgi:hypothetical protein
LTERTEINGLSSETLGRDSAIVLFLFAFVFRLIYILQSTDNPLFGFPVVDAHIYARWAARMSQGEWLWDQVGNYLPIYPAFLALQQIVLGANPFVNNGVTVGRNAGPDSHPHLEPQGRAYCWVSHRYQLDAGDIRS